MLKNKYNGIINKKICKLLLYIILNEWHGTIYTTNPDANDLDNLLSHAASAQWLGVAYNLYKIYSGGGKCFYLHHSNYKNILVKSCNELNFRILIKVFSKIKKNFMNILFSQFVCVNWFWFYPNRIGQLWTYAAKRKEKITFIDSKRVRIWQWNKIISWSFELIDIQNIVLN